MSSVRSMSRTLTSTPSTLTRGTDGVERSRHRIDHLGDAQGTGNLCLDPRVSSRDAFFERDLRLPLQNLAQPGVVRVAAAHALRSGHMHLPDVDAGGAGDHV